MVNKSRERVGLYPLGMCKNAIINIIENDKDMKALITGYENFTGKLKYDYVYDSLVIDLTQEKTKTYITMDAVVSSIESRTIKGIEITIDIFTHLSLKELTFDEQKRYYSQGYMGNRIDVLSDMLYRKLSGNEDFGIGELQLRARNPMSIFQPHAKYYGKALVFQMFDFRVV